jgi:predicted TIM-barrel fold metal-dependent hydrolase
MAAFVTEIIDADGHIRETDEDLLSYLDPKYDRGSIRNHYFFPSLDGWQRSAVSHNALGERVERRPAGTPRPADAAGWLAFLDNTHISATVLYPTPALSFGFTKDPGWAADLARAYNDFVFDRFLKVSPRLKAVALLPVQDPPEAARELRRAVDELGMVGGLLPAVGLRRPYGDAAFDPLYAEAHALDVPLAVHGASQQGLGFDFFENFTQGSLLSDPLSLIIQFTSMVGDRVFERFPRLKVAYLEAGCGWVPYLIERIDQRTARAGRHLASEQVRDHAIYFHAELEEGSPLPLTIDFVGEDRLIYASDYPHEPPDAVNHALESFVLRDDIGDAVKRKILCDNVKAMYALP